MASNSIITPDRHAALTIRGATRRFGATLALDGAELSVRKGELHVLLGENGAGKSTLMRLVAGLLRPDAGTMTIGGSTGFPPDPREAARRGIALVHQHFTSIPALSVAENIALQAGWPVAPRPLRSRVQALLERTDLVLDPDAVVEGLSAGLRQRLEIAKALAIEPGVLLLDEPTGVLTPDEVVELFGVLRRVTAAGGSVVLITHRLDEALAEGDAITVLRRGRTELAGVAPSDTDRDQLLHAMLGTDLPVSAPAPRMPSGAELRVEVRGVSVAREDGRGAAVLGADLSIRAGEIVAIAGIEGSGQRELLRCIAGVLRPTAGSVRAVAPVAFIPEDRTTEALVAEMSVAENIFLTEAAGAPFQLLRHDDVRRRAAAVVERAGVSAPGLDHPVGALSGGNQQKLILGRALDPRPAVLIAENPTRGLDVRAVAAAHQTLRAAAAEGTAILLYSTDLDEVLALGGRVLVMHGGRLVEAGPDADREAVGRLMLAQAAST